MCGEPSQVQWGSTVNTGFQSYSIWNDPVIQFASLLALACVLLIVTLSIEIILKNMSAKKTTTIQFFEYLHAGIIPAAILTFTYVIVKILKNVMSSEHVYYMIIGIAALFLLGYITKNLKEMFGGK